MLSPRTRRFLSLVLLTLTLTWGQPLLTRASAPSPEAAPETESNSSQDGELSNVTLPEDIPVAPEIQPGDSGQYVLEFNRSPVVGNRLRFSGIYDEKRLQFTRPRNWQADSVKVLLRYRHSAALYATRSNLTVLINGTSIGSVPLNQPQGEIGDAVFAVPNDLLQDYNELLITALQNNSPTCTQDPYDPSLWTEVMPDSKLVFEFTPQAVTPNFGQFPYPLFDVLSLQTNRIAYLQPGNTADADWLTATARLQGFLGRTAHYRPLENRIIDRLGQVEPDERLVVVGTPSQQPLLADLDLPFALKEGSFVDGSGKPLAPSTGLLMWTTTDDERSPILVVTGNGPAGVTKAAQYLVQPQDQQIATGHALVVNQVAARPAPSPRDWPGYLPESPEFLLQDLHAPHQPPLEDLTVRGSHAPALTVDFKALPDDQFPDDGKMKLVYSYGPQVNPLTSLVDVELDGVSIQGERLTSVAGADRKTMTVELPRDRITPTSKLQINFRLDPRERRSCSRVTDQQLWGTIHNDTSFSLNREAITKLPDLDLFKTGYPFTAPQDLSTTAVVLPEAPSAADIELMLELVERLGRLSVADSVQISVYPVDQLPEAQRKSQHLIAIGAENDFPFPDLLMESGFALQNNMGRQWGQSQVQTLPDTEGLIKSVISPWNGQRVVLALSGRTDNSLKQVTDLLRHDPLFYQLKGDTVLVNAQVAEPDPYDSTHYHLEFLQQSPQVQLATTAENPFLWQLTRSDWLLLVPATIALSLLIYGAAQAFLRRSERA